jgi:hypothetical protein
LVKKLVTPAGCGSVASRPAAESTSQELAQHRWHWTLDESNPKRVSMRDYTDEVGRSYSTIRTSVKGYALSIERDIPLGD